MPITKSAAASKAEVIGQRIAGITKMRPFIELAVVRLFASGGHVQMTFACSTKPPEVPPRCRCMVE
jgi:hypothetical protein